MVATTKNTVSAQEQNKFTMLCWRNQRDAVREMLSAHPDAVHWRDAKTGDTGLTHVAALGVNDCDIAVLLLDGGADINAKNNNGWTPLMLATIARNGSEAHLALLLDRGADQTVQNNNGQTAEEIAKSIGRPAIAAEFDEYRQRVARKTQELQAQIETLRTGAEAPLNVRKKPLRVKPRVKP